MNTFKKTMLVCCFVAFSGNAAAIPTADTSTLAQTIADAALQMAQQAFMQKLEEEMQEAGFDFDEEMFEKEWEKQEELYKKQKEEDGYGWKVEVGNSENYKGGTFQNTEKSNVYIKRNNTDLDNATSEYKDKVDDAFREKHGLTADQEYMQESFDKELAYRKMLDEAYKEHNKRFELIEKLRKEVDKAETPAQKADLQLAIAAEQTAILNESLRIQTIAQMKDQESRLEAYRVEDGIYEAFGELDK